MNKKSLSLILLSLVFVSSLMFVSALNGGTSSPSTFLSEAVPWSKTFLTQLFRLGDTWNEFIIGIIILAIMIAALYDILALTSVFQGNAVKIIISVGLGLVFAITGMVNGFSIWMIEFAAGFGAGIIWLEIIAALIAFVGIIWGGGPIQRWAARRKSQFDYSQAIEAGGKIRGGIKILADVTKEAEKSNKGK
ncbi:MAG: hypothetical protein WC511_03515 [Candidatus Pacearchaeota archaeon]